MLDTDQPDSSDGSRPGSRGPARPGRRDPFQVRLQDAAARVAADRRDRQDRWGYGFTRRQVMAGAGMAGVAALGSQLVTSRASFAASGGRGRGTLVVIFLRGGMDGLSVVVPADDPHLREARPEIAVPGPALLPLDRGFGFHPALRALHGRWNRGQVAAVPAVATPDLSRSHFQAQDCLERGGANTGATDGWLDRVLATMGPGTTFRAVGQGTTLPRSLVGGEPALSVRKVDAFQLIEQDDHHDRTTEALRALYTGLEHPTTADTETTLTALDTASDVLAEDYRPAVSYPEGPLATDLAELARLVKADVGLRVACVDAGGWDMHSWLGTPDEGAMVNHLEELDAALGAFADDLGPRLDDVTVVTMTEFGRRVEQNASAGTDHGHGGVVLLMGGGLAGGAVHGDWQGLAPDVLDHGDVPGLNDHRDVLGEVVMARLGLGQGDMSSVFPGHRVRPLGVMA